MEENQATYRDMQSIMVHNAERFGSRKYIISVDQNRDSTFSEFNRQCGRIANFFKDKEVKKDETISLIGRNSIETLSIYFVWLGIA